MVNVTPLPQIVENASNPDATQRPGAQLPAAVPSDAWLAEQVTNPGLAAGTEQAPTLQSVKQDELVPQGTGQVTPQIATPAATGTTQQAVQQPDIEVERVKADQAVAQEGTVTPESTVRGQLEQLMGDITSGDAPWADEAMRLANEAMAARGMGNSSVAAKAVVQAVLEAAMPIAQFDAGVYGAMNIQNLRNRQEAMLTNTAASNAAKNMNAQSANEVKKFMAGLRDSVIKFNATQQDTMSKFNAGEINATDKFYSQMEDAAEKFNATNALAISKSNAEWRRNINTSNTAAVNTANMVNAQNLFNMSQQAMADLWQRSRDVFNWANTSAENARDRAFQMTMYSMQRADFMQDMEQEDKNNLWEGIGNFAHDIFTDYLESN